MGWTHRYFLGRYVSLNRILRFESFFSRIVSTHSRIGRNVLLDTTFQGLIPYYFQILHPGNSLELNYCVWNNNNFSPFQEDQCASNQEDCEDCRLRPIEEIGLIHYTTCMKPWFCYSHESDDILHNEKCAILIREWFKTRLALEKSWGWSSKHAGTFHPEVSLGYCNDWGFGGYERMEIPSFVEDGYY
jgi:hypothetical protein